MLRVYIGLGSNIGCSEDAAQPQFSATHLRAEQLRLALAVLAQHAGIDVLATSSFYVSSPVGPHEQPDYVNAVACLQTELAAEALLDVLQAIEAKQGRDRMQEQRWGPRTLDLDILLYKNQLIETPRLSVPHVELTRRAFVLYPLAEIAAEVLVPGHGLCSEVIQKFEKTADASQQRLQRLDMTAI